MQTVVKISRIIDNISKKLGSLSVYLVIITFLVGFTNVVLRYVGNCLKSESHQTSSLNYNGICIVTPIVKTTKWEF